ncbi:MAG: cupin, partial [Mesorhizobium sp.]
MFLKVIAPRNPIKLVLAFGLLASAAAFAAAPAHAGECPVD